MPWGAPCGPLWGPGSALVSVGGVRWAANLDPLRPGRFHGAKRRVCAAAPRHSRDARQLLSGHHLCSNPNPSGRAHAFRGGGDPVICAEHDWPACGPSVVGILSDWLAPNYGDESLRWALFLCTFANFWAAFHYWRAGVHFPEGSGPGRSLGERRYLNAARLPRNRMFSGSSCTALRRSSRAAFSSQAVPGQGSG